MKAKAILSMKPEDLSPFGVGNKGSKNKVNNKKPNVRTTDIRKLIDIVLHDSYYLTRDEFMFLQKRIGYQKH